MIAPNLGVWVVFAEYNLFSQADYIEDIVLKCERLNCLIYLNIVDWGSYMPSIPFKRKIRKFQKISKT